LYAFLKLKNSEVVFHAADEAQKLVLVQVVVDALDTDFSKSFVDGGSADYLTYLILTNLAPFRV